MCYSAVDLVFFSLYIFHRRLGILNIRNKLFFQGNASSGIQFLDFFTKSAKELKLKDVFQKRSIKSQILICLDLKFLYMLPPSPGSSPTASLVFSLLLKENFAIWQLHSTTYMILFFSSFSLLKPFPLFGIPFPSLMYARILPIL